MGSVVRAGLAGVLGLGLGLVGGLGCARPSQAPPSYVVPVIGLPPIPIDTNRPGLDVRAMPTAETMAAAQRTVRLPAEVASTMLTRRPVRLGYPEEARQRGLSGYVKFRIVIGRDGVVEGLTLVETTNNAFVRAATASVQSWQYRPYLVNGKAVAVDTLVRVEFVAPN